VELKLPASASHIQNYIASKITSMDEREAKNIAFLILEYLYGISRTDLLAAKELPELDALRLEEIIARLNKNEPIQYILEETAFYGRVFKVKPGVLIPRPETEELVDKIIKQNKGRKKLKIADIGTGSGCIAITLAKELSKSEVFAIDISRPALSVTMANAVWNHANLQIKEYDILGKEAFIENEFDIIVSNPPYVKESEKALMHKNVLDYEPALALFVEDADPLLFYRAILEKGQTMLKKGGKYYFEINESQGEELAELMKKYSCGNISIEKDINGKDRFAIAEMN